MEDSVRFGDLFGRAWGVFKSKFALLVSLVFVFSFIPNLIYTFWAESREGIWDAEVIPATVEIYKDIFVTVPGVVIISVLSILMTVSVIYLLNVKSKKVMSFGEAIRGGSGFLWSGILLTLLLIVFLIPLYLLLVIPGIIFSIYWVFAFNALIIDKTSVRKSLTKSHEAVVGRWWKVFGYLILYILIIIGVTLVGGLIFLPLGIVGDILNLALASLVSIFGLVFFNEFYLALRKKK